MSIKHTTNITINGKEIIKHDYDIELKNYICGKCIKACVCPKYEAFVCLYCFAHFCDECGKKQLEKYGKNYKDGKDTGLKSCDICDIKEFMVIQKDIFMRKLVSSYNVSLNNLEERNLLIGMLIYNRNTIFNGPLCASAEKEKDKLAKKITQVKKKKK